MACRASPPSISISQICEDPPRSEIYAIRLESGDQRARWLASPSCVSWRGAPPASGAIQICDGFLLAAVSTVWTVNVTHLPSGEICGSPIRFNSIMAAKSKGFFCAKTIASEASVRMSQRRIHDDCNAPPSAWTWNRDRLICSSAFRAGRARPLHRTLVGARHCLARRAVAPRGEGRNCPVVVLARQQHCQTTLCEQPER